MTLLSTGSYSTDWAGNVIRREEGIAAYEELQKKTKRRRSARCWKNVDWWRGRAETTDVLRIWLILGEMETLFKISRYALETVKRLWSWNDYYDQCGLKQLMGRTVDFYVAMNVLYARQNGAQRPEKELGKYRTGWLFGEPSGPLSTAELPPAK
ncbi:hypothetical protein N7499_003506 [Penicillium canescens]|uniref:Uncharacterized protein n=1 Tax=Penicillium canescens TaxID=5083 RepID=A0AAD6IAL5_PENCN|nr:uncharacterized protein N7446_012428 [Penicillium canescens]KAJ6020212.1 hypothetical protein N7522_000287 [Penicillium canescens]KAJ6038166.1 hypothetical protein N7460_007937 [Penicillium canescens]KAJ6045564.1 hypothetical protein N7446_012428 [Penicillium canescens]KAJ6061248.1 hypothetical protein N7444_001944 [Penicillium canescens]KAJ6090792.1 hypothetical protein N7499_003506 [Penicillium canescens]